MALQLTHETPAGVSGNYWVITDYYVSPDRDSYHFTLKLYKDAAAYTANKEPLRIVEHSAVRTGSCLENAIPGSPSCCCEAVIDTLEDYIQTATIGGIDFTSATEV